MSCLSSTGEAKTKTCGDSTYEVVMKTTDVYELVTVTIAALSAAASRAALQRSVDDSEGPAVAAVALLSGHDSEP